MVFKNVPLESAKFDFPPKKVLKPFVHNASKRDMQTLGDVTNASWTDLARDYLRTNSTLLTRMLIRGIDIQSKEETWLIDDWCYKKDGLTLFRVDGLKEEKEGVPSLVGCMVPRDPRDPFPIVKFVLKWSNITFSWRALSEASSAVDEAFSSRHLDPSGKIREIYFDVPFCHPLRYTVPVSDVLEKKLHPFFGSTWSDLGPDATKYLKERSFSV